MQRTISFTLNGKPARIAVDDERMLLWVLRSDLGLTGTKFGCGEALCGACTVIVEQGSGPVLLDAGQGRGRQAGADHRRPGHEGGLHPIQQAFLKHHAFQCGYCTPGMILSAYALLLKTPQPTRDEDHPAHGRQPVPLRLARAHPGCHRGGRGALAKGGCADETGPAQPPRLLGAPARHCSCFSMLSDRAQEPARLPVRQALSRRLQRLSADRRRTGASPASPARWSWARAR